MNDFDDFINGGPLSIEEILSGKKKKEPEADKETMGLFHELLEQPKTPFSMDVPEYDEEYAKIMGFKK